MMKKVLMSFVALAAIAAAATGPARAQSNEQLFYTLDGTVTNSNTAYNQASEITQNGVTWSVTGNTNLSPWRIGGKSLNAVDREVYSTGTMNETITKVNLDFGNNNGVTVNSVTMIVASDDNFQNVIDTKSVTYSMGENVDVTPSANASWTNAYYKFVFNVSVSGSSNKYLQLKSIKFYYDANAQQGGGSTEPALYTVKMAPGTEDSVKWVFDPMTAPTTGVAEGTVVNISYGGTRKVKSVVATVVPDAPPTVDLDNTTTAWADGIHYAVPAGGLTYSAAITVSGNVTLVLTDGETLTLNKGISLAAGATLTIQGNGTMNVNGTNNSTASTVAGSGTLVMTSGTLNAKGGNGQSLTLDDMAPNHNTGASGGVAINGNVTVSGGTVTATGGNGGNLNTSAAGGAMNSHGGNGGAAISGSVTVNGGTWTATNGSNGTYTSASGDYDCSAGAGGAAVAGTVTDNR